MASAEPAQLYAKVSSRTRGRGAPPSLLEPLLAMGYPAHSAGHQGREQEYLGGGRGAQRWWGWGHRLAGPGLLLTPGTDPAVSPSLAALLEVPRAAVASGHPHQAWQPTPASPGPVTVMKTMMVVMVADRQPGARPATLLKALAATGRRTVEDASDWLRSHQDDPSLDDPIPQEFALFLCPTGPLLARLLDFWRESQRQCSRNRAHEVFPHVTLCDFFTCEDHRVDGLYEALRRAGDRTLPAFPPDTGLALHSSISYLGFFLGEGPCAILREFAANFATEASLLADCSVKPCSKQLHLTLAHKFLPHHQRTLEQLARSLHPGLPCQWTAALYSRDMRFVHYQTLRALFQYQPRNVDELALSPGDLVLVDPTQQDEASEGWVIGTSQRTGCRGFLPENYTERASESDTWVKHRTYTFNLALDSSSRRDGDSSGGSGEPEGAQAPRGASGARALQATIARRSLLVTRHGERVDQVFGKGWLQQCSAPDGQYHRPDLNFPRSLPRRQGGLCSFENDPPLSTCGIFQARTAGAALLDSGLRVAAVFSSPALRCVQTAQHLLEELKLDKKLKIRVEPGIFEWTKWETGKAPPALMSPEELREAGFSVSTDYRPALPLCSLLPAESYEEYVSRCSASVGRIVGSAPSDAGILLVVAHGSALDSCTRPLLGLPPRNCADFAQLVRKIPALGMCLCEENREEGRWELVSPPVKTLTHGANAAFNWRACLPGT